MYKIEVLQLAKNDMDSIIDYISNALMNKSAALKLQKLFITETKKLRYFHMKLVYMILKII